MSPEQFDLLLKKEDLENFLIKKQDLKDSVNIIIAKIEEIKEMMRS
jgi:hypothetical protein